MNQTVKRTARIKNNVGVKMRAFGCRELLMMLVAILVVSPACNAQKEMGPAEISVPTEINLQYSEADQAISVSPMEAMVTGPEPTVVWRHRLDDVSGTRPTRWEIRWKQAWSGTELFREDYFGAVQLEVGHDSGPVRGQGLPADESDWWPYSVTLIGTDTGGRELVLATVDPRIRWDNR